MRLLEDLLTDQEIRAIGEVLESQEIRFDILVRLSGLDRAKDFKNSELENVNFCGADLRGFDFSGSDLRGAWRNADTIIDDTTVFADAQIDWVEVDSPPIVSLMQMIEACKGSGERVAAIKLLIAQHGKTPHVVKFLYFSAKNSQNVEEFLDIISFLPNDIESSYAFELRTVGAKLLDKYLSQSRNRGRKGRHSINAIDAVVERLSARKESLAGTVFFALTKNLRPQAGALKDIVTVEAKDLREAFAAMGRR